VVEKSLMGGTCFMMDGIVCGSVSVGVVCWSAAARKPVSRCLESHMSGAMQMGGRTITGSVRVAPDGFRSKAALRKWLERGDDTKGFVSKSRPACGMKCSSI